MFLAIIPPKNDKEEPKIYVEDSAPTVAQNIAEDRGIDYYKIDLSEDGPSLSGPIELSEPRQQVRRVERVGLKAGSQEVGEADVSVEQE